MSNSFTFKVAGMHCAACELLIEKKLSKQPGVKKADAKLNTNEVTIDYEGENLNIEELNKVLATDGYTLVNDGNSAKKKIAMGDFAKPAIIAGVIVGFFLLLQKLGIAEAFSPNELNLPAIFIIGVVASLSTCMAVVGGLVLTISSQFAQGLKTKPLVAFHIARLIGFFALGGVIGLIGSAFTLTPAISIALNIILFIVMLIVGINLLEVFPAISKFQPRMPKSVGSKILKLSEERSGILTSTLIGVLTFFLPCGFTQSMQLFALSTGSFVSAATAMFVFALGTFPALALISFASAKFAVSLQSKLFFRTAGFLVIFFAALNLYSALTVSGVIT